MNKTAIVILAVFLCSELFGYAGKLTEVTGPTQVTRNKDKIEGKVDTGIEMNDTLETLKGKAGITFEDGTKVMCTEFSKLTIDEFVYDPASGKGKLAMKATLGTVRYASGLIAKNNREEVKVKTPTASVAVRGTDFAMTVDELGRSLIILLPSLPSAGPPVVGTITVSNAAGIVTMTKAFQATYVATNGDKPSAPVLLNFTDESNVGSHLLLDTPKSVTQAVKEIKKETKDLDKEVDEKKEEVKTKAVPVQEPVKETTQPSAQVEIKQETAPTVEPLTTIVVPTATVNNGFTSDGVNAILTVNSMKGTIVYKVKADTNATFTITTLEGTTAYPLNFGDKLRVNIIQK
jgi:Sec-independent protein translocase protein TatA